MAQREIQRAHSEKQKIDMPEGADAIQSILESGLAIDNLLGIGKDLERADMPEGRTHRTTVLKRKQRHISRKETAAETIAGMGLPEQGEVIHVVSNSQYDFFSLVVAAVETRNPVQEFYGSTWTMNMYNVRDLLSLLDTGSIEKCSILTGTYFKSRESSVYATLVTGLQKRGHRFNAFINHTKVVLMAAGNERYVFEGSANFTHNPRLENFIICNDPELYEFHQAWMEEMLDR